MVYAILIFVVLIVGAIYIPNITNKYFPKLESRVGRALIASTVLFLSFSALHIYGYKLKGAYTFPIIVWSFIISSIVFFSFAKNTIRKWLIVLVLLPLLVLSIIMLVMGGTVYEYSIDTNRKILVTTGGFLGCPQNIRFTTTKFVIFDKTAFHGYNPCLDGIQKIGEVKLEGKTIRFLIYHNGEYDSENPYKYKVEIKNEW